ncbi:uncharacterized protein LOC120288403 isoform X3 [Eucalyptus grandis]|uniref:uncharacterized protein LOC120288403 isoform X3 n=1 Tax=Eucalyptus grandis TaxID=71139 RepID=UPI00192F0D73|nr:uncharacterized protein LOC120288403 isoform X3 [Eucalyptus grandis]
MSPTIKLMPMLIIETSLCLQILVTPVRWIQQRCQKTTAILPSRDINGTRDSDHPASNYIESIGASASDAAQPHIHSSFCEKETQDMAIDGRGAASVSGDSCIDKDRSETEGTKTSPDVQPTEGLRENIYWRLNYKVEKGNVLFASLIQKLSLVICPRI